MQERYDFCKKCGWRNECLSFFKGGRPPCGMVAEENYDNLRQLQDEIAALADYCEQKVMDDFTTDELDILLIRLRQLSSVQQHKKAGSENFAQISAFVEWVASLSKIEYATHQQLVAVINKAQKLLPC